MSVGTATPTRRPAAPRQPHVSTRRRQSQQSDPFDRDYWLTHCEGFRVDSSAGRLGFVEVVKTDGPGAPPLLVIRAGRLGRRLLHVPGSEVAFIVPRAERIWLH
jgi:hypothetical protein